MKTRPITTSEAQFEVVEPDRYERFIGNVTGDGTTSRGYWWTADFAEALCSVLSEAGYEVHSFSSLY